MRQAGIAPLCSASKREPGVCKKYPEAEIYGRQIGEEFPFFLLARRGLSGRRQKVMGELVRKRMDKMIGPLEESRNGADHDPIAGSSERAERVLLRRDHCKREARIVRQRII